MCPHHTLLIFIHTSPYIPNSVAKPYRRRLLDHVPLRTYRHGAQQEEEGEEGEGGEIEGSSLSLLDLVVKRIDSRSMAEACVSAFAQLQNTEGDIFERTRVIEHVKFWRDLSLLLGRCVYLYASLFLCVLVVGYCLNFSFFPPFLQNPCTSYLHAPTHNMLTSLPTHAHTHTHIHRRRGPHLRPLLCHGQKLQHPPTRTGVCV